MIPIYDYEDIKNSEIFARGLAVKDVRDVVSGIVSDVRARGDAALKDYTRRFDGVSVDGIELSSDCIDSAYNSADPEFLRVLTRAADNIREFHSRQLREGFEIKRPDGSVLGQIVTPIERVGLYVPGGTAAYPSTVLMNAIPARLAGCAEIIMCTPPSKNGAISPNILAAAKLAGVDRVFRVGGAQAIAAMAFGTQSVPRVDKITGPGNAYVAEAKRQVYGRVGIDSIAGPSEILVVADARSDAECVAADMLSQAEHDTMSAAVLVTDSRALALAVRAEIERQINALPRAEIARASIDANGKIIITKDIALALEASNRLAPEHLELCVESSMEWLGHVRHAGSVFLGRHCPEALGDYMAGANHTLPTSGAARYSSPLSVDDFVKKIQYTYMTPGALDSLKNDVALFARAEGLEAHALSALKRGEADA